MNKYIKIIAAVSVVILPGGLIIAGAWALWIKYRKRKQVSKS